MRFLKYFVAWWRTGLGNTNLNSSASNSDCFYWPSHHVRFYLLPQINVCFPTLLHFFRSDKLTGVDVLSKGWKLNNEINQFLWCLHLKPLCLMTVWACSISFWFKMELTVMIVKMLFLCASVCIVLADKCWLSCDYHTLISSTLFSVLKLIWMNQTQGTCLLCIILVIQFSDRVMSNCTVRAAHHSEKSLSDCSTLLIPAPLPQCYACS